MAKRAEQLPIIIKIRQGDFAPYVSSLKSEQHNAKAQLCLTCEC